MEQRSTQESVGHALEVYKIEYGTAAERFENIYKALWQNFNYMALLAAAILTFGKESLGFPISAFAAAAVVIAWYWISFEPLNKYGTDAEADLTRIEGKLTEFVNALLHGIPPSEAVEFKHFTGFSKSRGAKRTHVPSWAIPALPIVVFAGVLAWKGHLAIALPAGCGALIAELLVCIVVLWLRDWRTPRNVRYVVRVLSFLLHLAILALLWHIANNWASDLKLKEEKAAKVEVASPVQVISAAPERLPAGQPFVELRDSATALSEQVRALTKEVADLKSMLPPDHAARVHDGTKPVQTSPTK